MPIYDSSLSVMIPYASRYLVEGTDETRSGNASQVAQPLNVYEAADGPFMLTAAGDRLFRKLCADGLGRPELADDQRFRRNADRVTNRAALKAELDAIFAAAPVAVWLERLRAAGIPAGAIRTTGEALRSYETEARGMVIMAPHSTEGQVPTLRSPIALSGTPVQDPAGAPLLGQHTVELLRGMLGYSESYLAELSAAGIIGRRL